MRPDDFWNLSWYEFRCAIEGYDEYTNHQLDVMRTHASIVVAPHLKKPAPPHKLWPLPSDKSDKVMSKEETIMKLHESNRRRGVA